VKLFCSSGKIILFIVISIAMLMASSETAQAMTEKIGLKELTANADAIVIGTIVESSSQWNDEHTRITTSLSLAAEENLKGAAGQDKVVFTVPGGEAGGIREWVSDTPSFNKGEKVVLFLKKHTKEEKLGVLGGFQGKLPVKSGKVGNLPLGEFKSQISKALLGQPFIEDIEQDVYSIGGVTISGITPGSASAGTNSQVAITGSGFGSTAGQVSFFYQDGEPNIQGSIVSWSDTAIVVEVPVGIINNYSATASSGPVYVHTAGGLKSKNFPFTVTFSYGSTKWGGTTVSYKVNPNASDCTGEETAVQNAANTWNSVPEKSFAFSYAGNTTATETSMNYSNDIMWGGLSNGIIAQACTWSYISDGKLAELTEADIIFNDNYSWSTSSHAKYGKIDVESILLHEMGHWLMLRDLYGDLSSYPDDMEKAMYGFSTAGALKRNLDAADQAGIKWIYPTDESAQIVSDTIPAAMTAGQSYSVSVTVKNTGANTWTAANSYKLGAVGSADPFAATKILLDASDSIVPGQSKTFSFTMTAPTTAGTYTTDWQMLREEVAWFGDTLTKNVTVNPAKIPENYTCTIIDETAKTAQLNRIAGASGAVAIPGVINGYTITRLGNTIDGNIFVSSDLEYNNTVTSVIIPDTVTSIGDYAFCACSGLTSVTIPASVTSIGNHAFALCDSFTSAYFYGNAPATFGNSVFEGISPGFTIYYIAGMSGWTTPTWNGYPTATFESQTPQANVVMSSSTVPTDTNVTAYATATGMGNPTYQFWVKSPRDDTWATSGDYSTNNSYAFTEQVPGTYTVMAFAKSAGAPYSSAIQSEPVTVEFTRNNAVCALIVSGPNGSQPIGSSATFTAAAADPGGTPEYQFWVHDASGWRVVQNYSDTNTYTLNNLQSGSYVIAVYALDSNDVAAGNWDVVYYQTFVLNIGSSVSLDYPASVAVGGTVNLTAQAAGLTGVVYQFWYQTPDEIWHGSDYSANNSFSFTASASGAYNIVVYAKDLYAPNTAQFSVSDTATVN